MPGNLTHRQRARLLEILVWRLLGQSAGPALLCWARRLNEAYFQRSLAGAGFHLQYGRWGSCSARGRIYLSHRLLVAPPDLVRAVLLHELAHLGCLNHGPEFWRTLAVTDPDCRRRCSQLRRFGAAWSEWWTPCLRRLLLAGEACLEPSLANWEGFARPDANILSMGR